MPLARPERPASDDLPRLRPATDRSEECPATLRVLAPALTLLTAYATPIRRLAWPWRALYRPYSFARAAVCMDREPEPPTYASAPTSRSPTGSEQSQRRAWTAFWTKILPGGLTADFFTANAVLT